MIIIYNYINKQGWSLKVQVTELPLYKMIVSFLLFFVIVVIVRGQNVSCRASPNCVGGTGDNVGVAASGERCCLDNPDAMGYNPGGTEDCFPCIGESYKFLACKALSVDDH